MAELPIRRIVLYKHGVGYFERRGDVSGTALRLSFPLDAMDDVLKSLVALDLGNGQVLGVDFETQEDRAARIARGSIHLSERGSLLDLLRDLRGRRVRLQLQAANEQIDGIVIGIDADHEHPLNEPIVSLLLPERHAVRSLRVAAIAELTILDDRATEDLNYFLSAAQSEEGRRAATLRLSEGDHTLLVGYVAPAPAWRVSYRLLAERDDSTADGGTQRILLQGWGLFDNQLEEDLDNVELTLVAGMPVSFRYQLYEPHTPERPLIRDETRTVAAPVEFGAMETARAKRAARPPAAPAPMAAAMSMSLRESASDMSIDRLEASTGGTSVGEERGALFQYRVAHPISVARGQSAMVPIVATRLAGRKDLLYNPRKYAGHPVASLRLTNTTGLTLERGPTTVIEDGDYAGEAVLPFTTTGAELIIPYAVELGITIIEQTHHERQMASIRVRDSYLLVEEWEISRTTYQIYNALDRAAEVVIEQHLPADWDLNETPEPREQAQGLARWPVACAPQHETSFPIQLRRRIYRREEVRNTPPERLQEYLNNKYLDQQTFNALSQVLGLYAEIARRQQRLKMIEQERQQIYKHQQQTQGSLAPLGRDGDEGALRARYVALLGKLEDQLATLAAEEQQIQQQIAQIEQAAAKALARL